MTPTASPDTAAANALIGIPVADREHRLPADVRQQIAPGDFADFVDRLVQAGEADDAGYDEVRLRPSGSPAWLRITSE